MLLPFLDNLKSDILSGLPIVTYWLRFYLIISTMLDMGKSLSKQEIKAALDKIRSKYVEHAEKYDSGLFNIDRFNQRYMEALRIGLPEEQFIMGEVQTFQELVKKAEEKYAPKPQAVSRMADKLLEEFAARIERYPVFVFSEKADHETMKLAGMLREFEQRWGTLIPSARIIPPGTEAAALIMAVEPRVFAMLTPQSHGVSRAIDDLAIAYGRITVGERERERLKKEFFKECGFLLNLLGELFAAMSNLEEFQGAELESACQYIEEALAAFRLQEFRLRIK